MFTPSTNYIVMFGLRVFIGGIDHGEQKCKQVNTVLSKAGTMGNVHKINKLNLRQFHSNHVKVCAKVQLPVQGRAAV